MTETESFCFYEESCNDDERETGACDDQQSVRQRQKKAAAAAAALDKPPLHSGRHDLLEQPKFAEKHSRKDSRGSDATHAGGVNSDCSESIQFHVEGAASNMSLGSAASLFNSFRLQTASMPKIRQQRHHPGVKGHGHGDQGRSSSCDSIQFVLEESSGTPHINGQAPSEMSGKNNSSIHFLLEDNSSDNAVDKAVTTSKIAPTIDSSDSTIMFEVEDEVATTALNSHVKPAHHAPLKGTAPTVTKKKTFVSNMLRRATTNSMREVSSASPVPTPVPMEAQTGVDAAPRPHAMAPKLSSSLTNRGVKSAVGKRPQVERHAKYAGPVRSEDEDRSLGTGEACVLDNVQNMTFSPHDGGLSKQEAAVSPASHLDSKIPTPRAVTVMAPLNPHNTDSAIVPLSYMMEEMLLEAKLFTEHWKLFNDIQREEILRLREQIIAARAADVMPIVAHNTHRGRSDATRMPNTFAGALHPHKSVKLTEKNPRRNDRSASRYNSPLPVSSESKMDHYHPQRRQLSSTCTMEQRHKNKTPEAPEKNGQDLPLSANDMTGSPVRAVSGWFSRLHDGSPRDAAMRIAESLGVVWPPQSKEALFFSSGVRLTPQQRNDFYNAVEVQKAASNKVCSKLQAAFEAEEKRKKKRVAKKKSLVTRTSILRRAFALMDVDRKGVIYSFDFPALQQLLKAELEQMEATACGRPVADSVLSRARMEHRKAKGKVDTRTPSVDAGLQENPNVAAEIALYRIVLDVLFPLICSSGVITLDFTMLGLLVFGSMNAQPIPASADFLKWRQTSLYHFKALAQVF